MIRVAILGAGIGAQHLQAYRALSDRIAVGMIVDLDTDRAVALRGSDPIRVAASVDEALDNPGIDLIDICLPPHLHVPVTLAALNSGKHVVCEKPLATSLADIRKIQDAIATSGRDVFPVFQYRWGPSCAQMRALITAGLAGAPRAAALETHWSRGADYYAVPWRGTWAGECGGAVLGHAIHNHDLMTHFMGPVAEVSAQTATLVNPIETEDSAALSFRMVNGALCTSSITLGAAFNQTRLRFVFEHLTATSGVDPYAPGSEGWTFVARDPLRQTDVEELVKGLEPEPIGFTGFFSEIAKALAEEPNIAVRFSDGAASVELVTAIYHAARTGSRVSLPLPTSHPLFDGWLPRAT